MLLSLKKTAQQIKTFFIGAVFPILEVVRDILGGTAAAEVFKCKARTTRLLNSTESPSMIQSENF